MNYDLLFSKIEKPIELALIGIGGFNHSMFIYGSKHPKISIRVACGRDTNRIKEGYKKLGVDESNIVLGEDYMQSLKAFKDGKYLIFSDVELAMKMPVDVVVEGTGNPTASLNHVLAAIENNHHVVNVTKESDSVVGSILSQKAKEKGVIYSLAEGDQPSLLVGLISWVKAAGLKIISVGKSSEYDFIYDQVKDSVTVLDTTIENVGISEFLELGNDIEQVLIERSRICSQFSQKNVPDFTEMQIVCNHVPELHPDTSDLHTPIAKTLEIPTILTTKKLGGILNGEFRIDVVNNFRRADEASLEGGVYVVVECDDEETWQVLKEKGVPVSRNGKAALIYYPAHYLGFEALFSVYSVYCLGIPTGSDSPVPRYDVVGKTICDIPKGTKLKAVGHHHIIKELKPLIMPAEPISSNNQLPYFMADSTTTIQDIPKDTLITSEMLMPEENNLMWKLRKEQDKFFKY